MSARRRVPDFELVKATHDRLAPFLWRLVVRLTGAELSRADRLQDRHSIDRQPQAV